MKEENLFQRRFSLCPSAVSPPKIDPHVLTRNLSYSGDNDLYNISTGSEADTNGLSMMSNELSPAQSPSSKSDSRMFNGVECPSPTEKLARKESLKVQKQNYRQEKKRAAMELSTALKDPSVVIMSNWLKIRGSLKSWTKLWCALRPGVLLIYKTPKTDHWVGTILLSACKLIERPSKKDGFCFKLYHPLEKSIWAVKGPKGENVGSITQPLPSNYLIFRAASESDGRCWMDALELALSCSSLYKLSGKAGKEGEISTSSESSHIFHLLQSTALSDTELLQLNDSGLLGNHNMEHDGFSDKSEREGHDDWDTTANENGGRLTEESDIDQSDELLPGPQATAYTEQSTEEMGEAGEASQVETVSEENKGLIWGLIKQLRPGMDLSKVVLPTFILEPRSFLDKLSDYYYHADLLSQAALEESAYDRIKQVLRWYLSGFYKKPKGLKKPYNPILGETFRCCWLHPQTDSCTFYIAEQVSHHPPISAFHICNRKDGFSISGSILAKSKFYGNSLSAILDGKARLLFLSREEEYIITMPYAHCKGILYGTMTLELGGKVTIECEKTKCFAELEFKLKPFLGGAGSVNQISGKIHVGDELAATVDGHWDNEVFIHEKRSGLQEMLWNPSSDIRSRRLKRQVVLMDEQGPFESEKLWQHVTSAILERDQVRATQEKFVLEEAQRKEAKERGDKPWASQLFQQDPVTSEWTYKHADIRPWDNECCLVQFEKDGIIQTQEKRQHNGLSYRHSWGLRRKADNGKRRKASSQPSSCSQNTESSSTTPEPTHESSDNEGFSNQCARCNKEGKDIALIEASISSIKNTQQDIQRNLVALSRQMISQQAANDSMTLTGRHCLILCVLLLSQLLFNCMFT
uniref:Oxysterol-binding protein n=1 Tax=Neogobius melanostomus TaxID=47308 RepID=A0A8C6WWU6_9GOBI